MASRAGDSVVLAIAALIFVAQQVAISSLGTDGSSGIFRQVLFFTTTVALALLALKLRRYWGAWLVALGILLNLVPMAAHRGSMPIDYAVIERSGAFPEVTRDDIGRQTNHGKDIVLERDDIHFFALSDRYVITLPVYGPNIYSLGDFVLFAGLGAVVTQAVAMAVVSGRRATQSGGATASR
ncbi:DUF5317 family protein [Candidatus Amarobacter glycogenicus]|uniref:DUF5317 family protein n=1 Tax=Candidatus Amarobacter glycogenicus TaxID=3140699 RepID=UPI002A1134A2|nr:DUF5317 family protein [Dehalococcoidia bacterium]